MWTATRKPGQKIEIGGNIFISWYEIDGDEVKLRIVAPLDVSIVCEELIGKPIESPGGTEARSGGGTTDGGSVWSLKSGGNRLVLGGNIFVKVWILHLNRVKIGVDAPPKISVRRVGQVNTPSRPTTN